MNTLDKEWSEFCKLGGLHHTEEAQVMRQKLEAVAEKRGKIFEIDLLNEHINRQVTESTIFTTSLIEYLQHRLKVIEV